MKKLIKLIFLMLVLSPIISNGQKPLVHPGLSHKLSDLDRMKYMVEARTDPWQASFQDLASDSRASFNYEVQGNASVTRVTHGETSYSQFGNDGLAAYLNSLMWAITEDERHAQKCVEIFNSWSNLTEFTGGGTESLNAGRVIWKMLEAAEIIRHTYSGWDEGEIKKFEDMLVYPGYSNTQIPPTFSNTVGTFYWRMYQGDPGRHGNQDVFGFRGVLAIGVFLDNEIIVDRALRYFMGLPHRDDDLPYESGPGIPGTVKSENEYFIDYNASRGTSVPDYGYNGVLEHLIWENGQLQESSRDQDHGVLCLGMAASMSEIGWNQGVDVYSLHNNRILSGYEYSLRYNVSYEYPYSDQSEPWEPTVENEAFIQRQDRTGRWYSKAINPHTEGDFERVTRGNFQSDVRPIYEVAIGHYQDRMGMSEDNLKWSLRARNISIDEHGYEKTGWSHDHLGWGGLTSRRVSPGDPISGFDDDGLPDYSMNVIPITIEAEHFDYFVTEGEGHTYHDISESNTGGAYRTDENVDIESSSDGGYNITSMADGEYLTYTIYAPGTGIYDLSIRYSAENSNGSIGFSFDGENLTGEFLVPSTGSFDNWADLTVAQGVRLRQGVHSMKLNVSGASSSFKLNNITVSVISIVVPTNLALDGTATQSSDRPSDGFAPNAIDGNTNGVYADGSVSHTGANATLDPEPWWQVDLEENYTIESINIFNRTDCCSDRLDNYTVQVIDLDGVTVFSEFFADYPNPSIIVSTGGVIGSVVRISKTSSTALSLTEVEVYGYEVQKLIQTITFEALLQKEVGDAGFIPGATTSSGLPVSYTSSNSDVATIVEGNIHIINSGITLITASQSGDGNYNSATNVSQELIVLSETSEEKQDQTITFADLPVKVVGDADFSPGASPSSGLDILYASSNTDVATIVNENIHVVGPGTSEITALQVGNDTYNPISVSKTLTVNKQDQTITFSTLEQKEVGDADFSPGATSSSGLSVNYTSSNTEIATIVNGNIHILDAGSTTITASQSGNNAFSAAVEVSQELVIKYGQTITFETLPVKAIGDAAFSPGATSSSNLPITYTSSDAEVATVVDGNIQILSSGISMITASQAGDGIYNAAADVTQTLAITPGTTLSTIVDLEGISFHPNPVLDILQVDFENDSFEEYVIYNINGRVVVRSAIDKGAKGLRIGFEGLKKGMYLIQFNGDQATKTFKAMRN